MLWDFVVNIKEIRWATLGEIIFISQVQPIYQFKKNEFAIV